MSNFRKYVIYILLASCILSFVSCTLQNNVVRTDDVSNLNSGEYQWFGKVFSKSTNLPDNAEVIDYYYYYYLIEANDEYLELRFKTEEETLEYLKRIKAEIVENLKEYRVPQYGSWFYEEQNPYNPLYTDVFCLYHSTRRPSLGEKPDYVGYSVKLKDDSTFITANCGIISYSIEEKTVIQTFFDESDKDSARCYFIPKYFVRFGVPTTENHERYIYFKW